MRVYLALSMTVAVSLWLLATLTAAICCKDLESGDCNDVKNATKCPWGSANVQCCKSGVDDMVFKNKDASAERGGKKAFKAHDLAQA